MRRSHLNEVDSAKTDALTDGSGSGPILFLAQLPPPHHGQSAVAQSVHDILKTDAGTPIEHLWRGGAADAKDVGKKRLSKYFAFASFLIQLLWLFVSGRRYRLVYLGMAPWAHTAIRDALLAGVSKLVAKRVWLHVHGDGLEEILDGRSLKNRVIRRLIANTELIAITKDTYFLGVQSGVFARVIDLPNIAGDPGEFDRTPREPLTVSCLGNLDPRKGVLDFVETIGSLKADGHSVTASVVGGPTAQMSAEDLREFVSDCGLFATIEVTGRVSETRKTAILSKTDVFLYLSRHDLAPIALIEALAHGAVPIVLDIGGLADMVGAHFAKNVLPAHLTGEALFSEAKRIIAGYGSDPDRLFADKNAARRRYLDEFSPTRYRTRILAELNDPPVKTRPGAGAVATRPAELRQ